jgi:hypothetical protein
MRRKISDKLGIGLSTKLPTLLRDNPFMATTIGSRPPPQVSSAAPATRASTTSAATTSAPAKPADSFSSTVSAAEPLGRKTISQSPTDISNMGQDDLKKFEPAEIMGMTKDQFQAFREHAPFDDLSKDQKRAVLRKTILRSMLDYLVGEMSKHSKIGE